MSRRFAIVLCLGLFINALGASPHKRLLVVGVDGCRPDALLKCNAPNLRALAANGIYTWHALSRPPTKSGPCWSSIFTGHDRFVFSGESLPSGVYILSLSTSAGRLDKKIVILK